MRLDAKACKTLRDNGGRRIQGVQQDEKELVAALDYIYASITSKCDLGSKDEWPTKDWRIDQLCLLEATLSQLILELEQNATGGG